MQEDLRGGFDLAIRRGSAQSHAWPHHPAIPVLEDVDTLIMSPARQRFDHFFITRQAVEDGLGIGIGPLPMLAADVASGRLMVPLPQVQVRRTGYVALVLRHADPAGFLQGFVAWLAAEGKQTGA